MTNRILSTPGQQAAARAAANPVTPTAGVSTMVAMEDFTIHFRGQALGFRVGTRYAIEPALKAAILATDRDFIFES